MYNNVINTTTSYFMKIVFNITDEQFNRYKNFVKENITTDFYTVDAKSELRKGILTTSPSGQRYHERLKSRLAPYNRHVWIDKKMRLHVKRGFVNDDKRNIYSYATHSGNAWGVYLTDEKPYLFFIGAEAVLMRLPFLDELVSTEAQPIVFEYGKDTDKAWFELGFVPQMVDMTKAVNLFKGRNFNEELDFNEQVIWDKWVTNQEFLSAVMRKQ